MRRFIVTLGLAAAMACSPQDAGTDASHRSNLASSTAKVSASTGTGRYLVVFKSESLPSNAAQLVRAAGGTVDRAFPQLGVLAVSGRGAFAAAMAKSSSVMAVGQERFHALPETMVVQAPEDGQEGAPMAADNLYGYQWDMRRINAPAVWAALPLPTNGHVATVAVLDVGVTDNHPDLIGQVVVSKSTAYCSTAGGPGLTAGYPIYSTFIDFDAHPEWSPADGCTPTTPTYEWHGTHVAGTIAAKFGGGRVVGVDPDARIVAYKVFDRFRYTENGVVVTGVGAFDGPLFDAIVDAVQNGVPVISMSLGSVAIRNNKADNASWLAWNRVAQYANRGGAVVVASAGNEELNLNGNVAHLPSDVPTILSTSATGISELVLSAGLYVPAAGAVDTLASYSNYGAASIDVAAPGGDCGLAACERQYLILSDGITPAGDLAYYFAAGTSMATPHVSAVVAMVRALHPEWEPGKVRSFIKETAQDLGNHQAFGHGLVMADAVLH